MVAKSNIDPITMFVAKRAGMNWIFANHPSQW
jgi:hypothetical protein